jgi:hypothetical protein
MYQTGPRARSTLNTCPLGGLDAPAMAPDHKSCRGHIGDTVPRNRYIDNTKAPHLRGFWTRPERFELPTFGSVDGPLEVGYGQEPCK